MKTIRERAYIAVGHPLPPKGAMHVPDNKLELWEQTFVNGYIKGATEQRDIDIEKATEWLNANWRKYIDTDADGMIRFSGWKKDFEKAMKDESNM